MSVPTYKRDLSKIQYLYNIYNLNITLGQMVQNLPSKYLYTYGNELINSALSALDQGQYANRLYIQGEFAEKNYEIRREIFDRMLGYIDHIGTVSLIYLEICKRSDQLTKKKQEKIDKYEINIGTMCSTICKMIMGIKKYDIDTINKYRKKKIAKLETKEDNKIIDIKTKIA